MLVLSLMKQGEDGSLQKYMGNPIMERMKESWIFIARLYNISSFPWIIGGDFNEIASNSKKMGSVKKTLLNARLSKCNNPCGLINPRYKGDNYT